MIQVDKERWRKRTLAFQTAPAPKGPGAAFIASENLPLCGSIQKAYRFSYVIKTSFDLLALACGLAIAAHSVCREPVYGRQVAEIQMSDPYAPAGCPGKRALQAHRETHRPGR